MDQVAVVVLVEFDDLEFWSDAVDEELDDLKYWFNQLWLLTVDG